MINKEIKNSNLPEEIRIGAVLRDKKVIIPRSNLFLKKTNRVVFLAKKGLNIICRKYFTKFSLKCLDYRLNIKLLV